MAIKMNVGFIGLGNIGKPMAKHMINERFRLHVYDLVPSAVQELVHLGATAAASPAALAEVCEYIGICVRDDHDVESLLYGDGGLLANACAGTAIAIHSTVTTQGLLRWGADAAKRDIDLIDAPITGGAAVAEAGTLCYMVGGDASTVARCSPMFDTSAQKIIYAGELGKGIALKLCNNLISFTELALMSEAVRLAEACGLAAEMLYEVGNTNGLNNAHMQSFVSQRNAMAKQLSPVQMEQHFGAFGRLGSKDLQYAIQTAEGLGLKLPIAETVRYVIEDVFLNKA